MSDWTAGYVADIGYTYGYYPELSPLRVKLAFLNAGLVCPEMGTACELGFGQGMSTNVHAAASLTQWHGTDFNPAQAGYAQELASAAGSGAALYDDAFVDFVRRPELPDFDYIGLHGIWSWISDENRHVIVDFVRRKLKVGGVLYISYNTLPGWAAFAPMRHLMAEHALALGAQGEGIVKRVDGALDFADRLLATNPIYARANPQVAERIKKMKGQDRNYLAHEYFNRDWHPMHFATMAQWLEPGKLDFACSANYIEHIDDINLTVEQQAFLKDIHDPMFRQSSRDFMLNGLFRKDYWVRGARRLSPLERQEQLHAQRVILLCNRADISLKVMGALGEATMSAAVYDPILDVLADHAPKSLGQLGQIVKDKGVTFDLLLKAVIVLAGTGQLGAVQDEAVIKKARARTDRLNASLVRKARSDMDNSVLASPVTGCGVGVGRFQQLFLLARSSGSANLADMVRFVWQLIEAQGQRLARDGKPMENADDNIAELTRIATHFSEKQMPILRALQIV